MPHKCPEARKAYLKAYKQSPAGKKSNRITSWKDQGIIVQDYNKLYDSFLSTTNCQKCNKELTEDRTNTHSTRCLDHDHNITDRPNFRMICCNACNANDNSRNTSGEPNISYRKDANCWRFAKKIQGTTYYKGGFKTKEEAINYKSDFLASTLLEKDS